MMAAKPKSNPLNGVHTAGIFADMSVDGPEIGTLVLIADRAKNLPNRKTIGKQDPYCAARLGKEAKKTKTDIRGGQTPKWDQELRFTVHDSPDYYQLKLSVFNDDKKTDLIGEAWIDLRDIIVPGGGQNDQWQTLTFKGKYAGDIRIETTFYDSRPKPDKPVAKGRPVASGSQDGQPLQKSPVKRRPLPSNPGSEAAVPKALPEHVQTPARPQTNSPAQSFIPTQSPLQAMEYNTPGLNRAHPDRHSPAPDMGGQYGAASHRADPQYQRSMDRSERFNPYDDDHSVQSDAYSQSHELDPRGSYNPGQPAYDSPSPPMFHQHQPALDDDRPPPPPVHRVRNNSGNAHDMIHRGSFDSSQSKVTPPVRMRHDVLRNEAQRHSVPVPAASAYPGRPTYRPYESAPDVPRESQYDESGHPSPPRHHSYDAAYDSPSRAMQPTVEDVPESWTPPNARSRRSHSHQGHYDDVGYDQASSPAPLNLTGRASAASGHYSPSPVQTQSPYGAHDYAPASAAVVSRDYPRGGSGHGYSSSYSGNHDPYTSHGKEMDDAQFRGSQSYALPPVPATLVPGVDPALSMEISTRFREDVRHERRHTQPLPLNTPTRGRQPSEPSDRFGSYPSPHGHHPSQSRNYGGSPVTYSPGPHTPSGSGNGMHPRTHSPNPNANHVIKRKSISPAPPPDGRRLSGVPFGPDSYDALNPSLASSNEPDKSSSEYTNAYGKIVTADGREVDPSDHLPMDTWAPEPEPKQSTPKSGADQSRPSLSGAQPMPASGRRILRVSARPHSMAATPPTYGGSDVDPSPPPSTGRNRLQKKAQRMSAMPAPISAGSSPLGPATSHQRNSTPPRALVHAHTFDYENHGPPYNGSLSGRRGSFGGGAPPIPAKVPLMSGGMAAGGMGGGGRGGGEDWALMEEMSRIDIGSGRARRHGGY